MRSLYPCKRKLHRESVMPTAIRSQRQAFHRNTRETSTHGGGRAGERYCTSEYRHRYAPATVCSPLPRVFSRVLSAHRTHATLRRVMNFTNATKAAVFRTTKVQ